MYETKQERPLARPSFSAAPVPARGGGCRADPRVSLAIGMAGLQRLRAPEAARRLPELRHVAGRHGTGERAGDADAGKLFAGLFALYAGLVFIVTAALLFTPLLHRLMHRFHWPEK